ncbi:MAG: imidazolonepropionase [Ignavibacteria bacterium]|nr:imidazolonepropionase [Ignavibacteria bacterium]
MNILIRNASQLVTCAGSHLPRAGTTQSEIGLICDGSVLISGEKIVFAGTESELTAFLSAEKPEIDIEYDAENKVVMPGFVDSHTHFVFAGSREDEYEMRLAGKSYQEIADSGGGIWSTVMRVRNSSEDELAIASLRRLEKFLLYGTTTLEGKSGYGLDAGNELKMLRVLNLLSRENPFGMDIVPTFLGAHSVPKEISKADYIELLCSELIPEVAGEKLAHYIDIFIEEGYYDTSDAERILGKGREYGLTPRTHIDQFNSIGGTQTCLDHGAVSLDHLEVMTDADIDLLRSHNANAERKTTAGLLPGVSYFLGIPYAPARKLIDAGVPVLIATDFNPGSSMSENMQMMMSLASTQMKMSAEEIITSVTVNPAYSLGMEDRIGSIEPGKQADLLIFDIPSYKYIIYNFGVNNLECVIKRGRPFKINEFAPLTNQ